MAIHKIAVIRGDGIGPEVVEEGLKVLRSVSAQHSFDWDFDEFPWGSSYYMEHGQMMSRDALDTLA